MMKGTQVTLEVDSRNNRKLLFRPANRALRGRFDPGRLDNPGDLKTRFRGGVPGERLMLDFAGMQAQIEDPLREPANADLRKRCAEYFSPGPERQTVALDEDGMATWAHFARQAVAGGSAHVVSGEFPEKVPGKPRLDFITTREPDPVEMLAEAVKEQNRLLAKQTELLGQLLATRA